MRLGRYFHSGVVNLETVKIALVVAVLMDLKVVAADIGSTYLQTTAGEQVHTIDGPEWKVLRMEGEILIVKKGLCGLKSSGAM